MRITFLLPDAGLAGGIRVVAIYAQWLQDRGHTVHVFSAPHKLTNLKGRISSFLRGRGWPTDKRKPSHMDHVSVPHTVIPTRRPIVDGDLPDADVVIATWWETAEWMAALSPTKGAKVYFIQHDERHANQPVPRVEATWKIPSKKIVVAGWLAELAKQKFEIDDVTLVPNGVDAKQFDAPPRSKPKQCTVGLMYSHTPWKGSDIAIEAYKIARRNVPRLKLVAFGTHDNTDVVPLPEEASYTVRPDAETMRSVYASADAWLFPSRYEGFGLPILEAMACRTPVIGTPAGAAPELIAQGGGILVKPEDPLDMATAIERVCRMGASEWAAMSLAARATAERNGWEACAKKFEAALIEAAAGR